jgi:hypothetical protein
MGELSRRDRRTSSLQPASTCTEALDKCLQDSGCKRPLQALLKSCDPRLCSLDQCRIALAEFFSVAPLDIAMDVAFCTCRDRDGQCENSLYRFFPSCYYEIPENRLQSCHNVARRCAESDTCRFVVISSPIFISAISHLIWIFRTSETILEHHLIH